MVSLNVIMLGPPGAGKGTQASSLAREYDIPKISTGEILREAVHQGSELGKLAKATMESGQLVGDDIMIAIIRERLLRPDACRGFVLDGFPRTVPQAEALDQMMRSRGPLIVLHVQVPLDELVRRVASRRICSSCGMGADVGVLEGAQCPRCGGVFVQRLDDEADVVRERLRVYQQQTEPLVRFYEGSPTFFEIDGNQSPDAVSAAIAKGIAVSETSEERPDRPVDVRS